MLITLRSRTIIGPPVVGSGPERRAGAEEYALCLSVLDVSLHVVQRLSPGAQLRADHKKAFAEVLQLHPGTRRDEWVPGGGMATKVPARPATHLFAAMAELLHLLEDLAVQLGDAGVENRVPLGTLGLVLRQSGLRRLARIRGPLPPHLCPG